MSVRCVVTGTRDGKSVFASDRQVEPIAPHLLAGVEFYPLWGADDRPRLPTDGTPPAPGQPYFPPPDGFRFGLVVLPPERGASGPDGDVATAAAEIERLLPGLMAHMEPDHPGMHTTDTVDFDVVLSGEIFLELDDAVEVRLERGDCVIQNGTRHAWHNRSSAPCVLGVAIVGARRG